MNRKLWCTTILLALPAAAQQPVPSEFQTTYSELTAQVASSKLTQGWDGSKYPVYFGGEVSPASNYSAITQAGYYKNSVTPFLNALQTLGDIKVVKVLVHFPMLYIPFYTNWPSSGGMTAYNTRLSVYQALVADLHKRGIKIIVQSMVQGVGNTATLAADPLNLAGYYQTLSFNDYVAARASHTLSVCRLLQPDYVNFDSEPDTEGGKSLQSALDPNNQAEFIANNLTLVTTIRDTLVNADPPIPGLHTTLRLAIGMGSWERYLPTLVTNFTTMAGIDIIDIHVHPINLMPGNDYLADIGTIANAAIAQGKAVGMDETWLDHDSNAEVTTIGQPEVDARNGWGFWAPLDTSFLTLMMNVANFRHMEYVSFSVPSVFFAYLDYANTPGCPTPPSSVCSTDQWNAADNQALGVAETSSPVPLTTTGQAFEALLAAQAAVKATTVSAASFTGPNFAPDSIVSIFGAHLATTQASAGGGNLPTTLGGTTATIEDVNGNSAPLLLVLVSPTQLNAVVPHELSAGPATVTVRASDGVTSQGSGVVALVAPGIFAVDGNSLAAAIAVKTAADGSQTSASTAQCSASGCSALPIDLGAASDSVSLVLFGTGIRGASPGNIAVTIGGVSVPVTYSGAQPQYPGLDQVNVTLPRSLAGSGTVVVEMSAGAKSANSVTVAIR